MHGRGYHLVERLAVPSVLYEVHGVIHTLLSSSFEVFESVVVLMQLGSVAVHTQEKDR